MFRGKLAQSIALESLTASAEATQQGKPAFAGAAPAPAAVDGWMKEVESQALRERRDTAGANENESRESARAYTSKTMLKPNPTTRNRQGPDVGDQYRSAIFTFSASQAGLAKSARDAEQAERKKPVVTFIEPIGRYWKAEEYHQQYDEKTGTHSCPLPKGLTHG